MSVCVGKSNLATLGRNTTEIHKLLHAYFSFGPHSNHCLATFLLTSNKKVLKIFATHREDVFHKL